MNDEKAIEQLEEFLVIDDWSAVYMPYLQDAIEYVINRIKALEEERPQGEWIYDTEHSITIDMYKCSVCGCYGHTHFNFCPNCGADMRGDNND